MKRSLKKNMNVTWEEAEWRQRVAQYYQHDAGWTEQNRTEQQNSIFYFVFWKYFLEYFVICKIFLKLLFENTSHDDEEWGHILSVQLLPVLSITYLIIG